VASDGPVHCGTRHGGQVGSQKKHRGRRRRNARGGTTYYKAKPQLALGRPKQRNIWALVGQAMAEALLAAALEGDGRRRVAPRAGLEDTARCATVTEVHYLTRCGTVPARLGGPGPVALIFCRRRHRPRHRPEQDVKFPGAAVSCCLHKCRHGGRAGCVLHHWHVMTGAGTAGVARASGSNERGTACHAGERHRSCRSAARLERAYELFQLRTARSRP
jgi:hypothetical protein